MFKFGKKKRQPMVGMVEDSRVAVYDFLLRSTVVGFESYRPADYHMPYMLEEAAMYESLNNHLDRLLSGSVDDGNADMLDALVFGAAREALPELNRQRSNHVDTIRRLVIRHKADREEIAGIKEQCENSLKKIQADYSKTCKMLAKYELCEEAS